MNMQMLMLFPDDENYADYHYRKRDIKLQGRDFTKDNN